MRGRASTSLWYGETGTGKTSQIGEVAEWWFKLTGEISRLVSADSTWDPIEHLMIGPDNPSGCIEAWNISYLPNPFAALTKLSEGYWPMVDPASGKLRMAPPKKNDKGQLVNGTGLVVGNHFNEGISTFSDLLLLDHTRNTRKISQDVVGEFSVPVDIIDAQGKDVSQLVKFGKAAPAHYGQVQEYILADLAPRFGTLPVARVIWTGHEAKGDDDVTGIKNSVLGPLTAGKAATGRTAKKYGDTFHFQKVVKVLPAGGVTIERRAYYEDHPDDVLTKMLWPAKISFPLSRVEELRKKFPGGFIPLTLTNGLVDFLKFKEGF